MSIYLIFFPFDNLEKKLYLNDGFAVQGDKILNIDKQPVRKSQIFLFLVLCLLLIT